MNGYQIKKNQKNGAGVFSTKDFEKDELIMYVDGETTEATQLSSFPQEIQDHVYPFDKIDGIIKYVLPQENSSWKYLNHSCDPNAGIKNNREIVAMRPIKAGEEIVFDYAMNNVDDYEMECNCGSSNCRGKVMLFDALDEETKERYKDYVLNCIRIEYEYS